MSARLLVTVAVRQLLMLSLPHEIHEREFEPRTSQLLLVLNFNCYTSLAIPSRGWLERFMAKAVNWGKRQQAASLGAHRRN